MLDWKYIKKKDIQHQRKLLNYRKVLRCIVSH